MRLTIKITIMTSLLLVLFQALSSAGPRLTFRESEFDFGYAPQKSKIAHDFWLYSTGTDTLKIVKVDPG